MEGQLSLILFCPFGRWPVCSYVHRRSYRARHRGLNRLITLVWILAFGDYVAWTFGDDGGLWLLELGFSSTAAGSNAREGGMGNGDCQYVIKFVDIRQCSLSAAVSVDDLPSVSLRKNFASIKTSDSQHQHGCVDVSP